ncbi:hypothetical protein CPB84DRAFT_1769044 [Gymnopilus junonius]|uniref:Uncharacterized protein n=1 Tax=Gymnopilus junonius TaxID=109634 RepID=A0A9P5TQV6_GYMJU|nr:hypothetical protein CPB84DRAFT_1769044 [Gymnopilus junonius]
MGLSSIAKYRGFAPARIDDNIAQSSSMISNASNLAMFGSPATNTNIIPPAIGTTGTSPVFNQPTILHSMRCSTATGSS